MSNEQLWQVAEALQGDIAAEIRVMLGEAPLAKSLFTPEDRRRRIEAMQKCAAESTSDIERHEAWMKMHVEAGWVYGLEFDPVKKTHPNLLPWDQLPATVKPKARIFDLVAKAFAGLAARNGTAAENPIAVAEEDLKKDQPGRVRFT